METAIVKNSPMGVQDIKANIKAIQDLMKSVMKEGVHYGKIPGCGDKDALLKPGSEVLQMAFRIASSFTVEDLSTNDEYRYRITTSCTYIPDGNFLGAGLGECSSNEEKFKWRTAVCDEEFDETPENRRRIKWKKGYFDNKSKTLKPPYKIKQVREEQADKANTVLKMAVKRSLIGAILNVTGASDIFTQDIEDEIDYVQEDTKSTQPEEKFACSECGELIKKEVHEYSVKNFKKALCFNHQKAAKNG